MSIEELERVMQRALRDEAFRALLQVSPDTALAEFQLSADERAIILGVPPEPARDPNERERLL